MPRGVVIFFGHSDRFLEKSGQSLRVALILVALGIYSLRERVPKGTKGGVK